MNKIILGVFLTMTISAFGFDTLFDNNTEAYTLPFKKVETLPDGTKGRLISWKNRAETSQWISIATNYRLKEFEKCDFIFIVDIPEGCSAEYLKVELCNLPGQKLDSWHGKPIFLYAKLPKQAGRHTVKIPFDIAEYVKLGMPPFPAGIKRISVRYDKTKGETHKMYISLAAVERKGLVSTLETGKDIYVYDINNKDTVPHLRFENMSRDKCSAEVEYKVSDDSGSVVDSGKKLLTFNGNEAHNIDFKKTKKQGVYHVDYTVVKDKNKALKRTISRRYAAMNPTGWKQNKLFDDGFLFSVCAHLVLYKPDEMNKMIEYIAYAGINHVRAGMSWARVQPQKDVWYWSQNDAMLNELTKYKIELEDHFYYAPKWAVDHAWLKKEGWSGLPYPQLEPFKVWVNKKVSRYKGRIRHYEVVNEINLSKWTPEQYIPVEKIAYEETKKADPKALVFSGSWGSNTHFDYLQKIYSRAEKTSDVIAWHHHSTFETYMGPVDKLLGMLREKKVNQPWFSNESAWCGTDDKELACILFKKLFYSWAKGSIGYTWYNLRNSGFNTKNAEHKFGLLTQDLYPRSAYVAYNMITGAFRGSKFIKELMLWPSVMSYRFENGKNAIIPFWNMSRDYADQPLVLKTDAKKVEYIDLYGNTDEINVADGIFVINVSDTPGTIRLSPANATLECVASLISTNLRLMITPDSKMLQFNIYNPFATKQRVKLSINLLKGIETENGTAELEVNPGMTVWTVPIKVAPDFTAISNPPKTIMVSAEYPDKHIEGKIVFHVQQISVIRKAGDRPHASFHCNRREQTRCLVSIEPKNAYLYWSGSKDLSAWTYVFYPNRRVLEIQVRVDDDKHNQPFHGGDMYKGDNLQLILNLPEQKGQWEIGFSLNNDGTTESYIWTVPAGIDRDALKKKISIKANMDKSKTVIWYNIALPLKELGTNLDVLKKYGFRFNVIINDNDGTCRESYMSIITGNPKKADNFPIIMLK